MEAAPFTAWAANMYACFLGIPHRTAPSASASINIYTKAGELPLAHTTAFISASSINSAFPHAPNSFSSTFSSTSENSSFLQLSPVMPSPIIAGVFGMARTILLSFPSSSFSSSMVFPGASEIITCSGVSIYRIPFMTSS